MVKGNRNRVSSFVLSNTTFEREVRARQPSTTPHRPTICWRAFQEVASRHGRRTEELHSQYPMPAYHSHSAIEIKRLLQTIPCMLQFLQNQANYNMLQSQKEKSEPTFALTYTLSVFYILSGVTQPLIMTLAKDAGIADARAQLYMLFYYLGPASAILLVKTWPSPNACWKAAAIALFDIGAQSLNYTGSALAGPTLFAIIYSSVTVWTAVFSMLLLQRNLTPWQWLAVLVVFCGLGVTGFQSTTLGSKVIHGSLLVLCGSIMHALTYVMSEGIMSKDNVSVQANCAIQGLVATVCLSMWQLLYTRSHWEEAIAEPIQAAGTTWYTVAGILSAFFAANIVHSLCFFHTLKHFPGGATSAGIMKALQAVLVFVFSSIVYCGRLGGPEMCFSMLKLISLVVVTGGVVLFGRATETKQYEQVDDVTIDV